PTGDQYRRHARRRGNPALDPGGGQSPGDGNGVDGKPAPRRRSAAGGADQPGGARGAPGGRGPQDGPGNCSQAAGGRPIGQKGGIEGDGYDPRDGARLRADALLSPVCHRGSARGDAVLFGKAQTPVSRPVRVRRGEGGRDGSNRPEGRGGGDDGAATPGL